MVINFQGLNMLTLHTFRKSLLFQSGIAPVHDFLRSRIASTKLPSESDLFLDKFGNELSEFYCSHGLCMADKFQQYFFWERRFDRFTTGGGVKSWNMYLCEQTYIQFKVVSK